MQITFTNRNFGLLDNHMYLRIDSFQTVNHVSEGCIAISSLAHDLGVWLSHYSMRTSVYK